MLCFIPIQINLTALFFFILFAVLFIALIAMYVYSLRLKRKTKHQAAKFSLDLKAVLDQMTNVESKIIYLNKTEVRVKSEKSYEKNPSGRDLLLSKIYQHKASVLFKANRHHEAIRACSQVLEVEPSHAQTYLNRAALYGETGDYQSAIRDLDQAELLEPRNPNIYNNRGWMYMHLKQYDKALSDLDYAISLRKSDVAYFNRGNVYREMSEWQKALEDYRLSLSLHDQKDSELRGYITEAIDEMNQKLDSQSQTTYNQ